MWGDGDTTLRHPQPQMNADFTEAVTPTSTPTSQPVKILRRGDVREDGRIFWAYAPDYVDGEWWITPEKYATKKAAKEAQRAKKKAELSEKKATLPVKLRQGDTRDGKLFWCYGPNYFNGEYWMTPEQFASEKSKEAKKRAELSAKKATLTTKLRRGDVRGDGMVFWKYGPSYPNGEYWMSPEQFATMQAANKAKQAKERADLSTKKAALLTKLRRGDTREDGMVFWSYGPSYANGEHWLMPEEFEAKKANLNAYERMRRATDHLYALKCRLRDRVSKALKRKGFKKNTKTAILLGCTYEDFKAYTEARLPPDMTWETFLSDGHLDHIVPLDAADTEADVYALNHYTNLRPLWGPDNIAKSDTLPEEHELPDNLHTKVKEIYLTAKARSA